MACRGLKIASIVSWNAFGRRRRNEMSAIRCERRSTNGGRDHGPGVRHKRRRIKPSWTDLEKTEKTVQQWHRARLLREYADALGKNEQDGKTAERLADVAWIRDAADWLDPLVAKVSPDVGDDE